MAQEVTVISDTEVDLKPLLQSAIRTEVHMLELELNRTRRLLQSFEQDHGMTTEDFERRFGSGELANTARFIEWSMELKTHRRLEINRQALQSARVD